MADAGTLEERTVEVNDPALSDRANHALTEAVRQVVGADKVMVPTNRPRPSQGQPGHVSPFDKITSTKMMTIGLAAIGICVGLIVAVAEGHWWTTALAIAVLLVSLYVVTRTILGLASTLEFPDPNLAALLSEEGIHDGEVLFSEIVQEFTPVPGEGDRSAAVEDDPAAALAEQQSSLTATGGPSAASGPSGE